MAIDGHFATSNYELMDYSENHDDYLGDEPDSPCSARNSRCASPTALFSDDVWSTSNDNFALKSSFTFRNSGYLPAGARDSDRYQLDKTSPWSKFWGKLLPGWRKGLALNSSFTATVLLGNIVWLFVIIFSFESDQGVYTIFKGSCSHTSLVDSGLHVLINVLSTALLGASNYAMQVLLAPTRQEVDGAHSRGEWLYIGIPNLKNLLWISWRRKILVVLLIISAWPLHLLWNSVIVKTLQANQYAVMVVSDDFISSTTFDPNLTNLNSSSSENVWGFRGSFDNLTSFYNFTESLYHEAKNPASMIRLENTQCMKAYTQPFISNRRNLLLVTNTTQHPLPLNQSSTNGSMLAYMYSQLWLSDFSNGENGGVWSPGQFICSNVNDDFDDILKDSGETCDLDKALRHADAWTITLIKASTFPTVPTNAYTIDYCLSETVPEQCQVQFFLSVMIIVIACNFIKLFCIASAIFTFEEPPLVVIGDALASFLERYTPSSTMQMQIIDALPKRWKNAAKSDLISVTLLSSFTLAVAGWLLSTGISSAFSNGETISNLGFGQASPDALVKFIEDTSESPGPLIGLILMINSPQMIYTLLYVMYSRAYTRMLAMHEWATFAEHRQSLRVSQPNGIQRSTYWLQVPYRYSIPLLIVSGVMHWLLSESLFLVRVELFNMDGQPDSKDPSSDSGSAIMGIPGYSPESIAAAIGLGGTMLLVLNFLSLRKFKSAIPLTGNNSRMINDACQRPDEDIDATSKIVKWGAVTQQQNDQPHCCLTSFKVEKPTPTLKVKVPKLEKGNRLYTQAICVGGFGILTSSWDIGASSAFALNHEFLGSINPLDSTIVSLRSSVNLIAACIGCLLTALILSTIRNVRLRSMILLGNLFCIIGTILLITSFDHAQAIISRVVFGIGNGVLISTIPIYITEISFPKENRGKGIAILIATAITGVVVSYWVSELIYMYGIGPIAFYLPKLPFGMEIVWSLISSALCWKLAESPRRYYMSGRPNEGDDVLNKLCRSSIEQDKMQATKAHILAGLERAKTDERMRMKNFFWDRSDTQAGRRIRTVITLAALMILQGTTFAFNYVAIIFDSSMIIGVLLTMVLVSIPWRGVWLIEKMGRRKWLLTGSILQSVFMAILTGLRAVEYGVLNVATAAMLFLWVLTFMFTWLTLFYVYALELVPQNHCHLGFPLAVSSQWLMGWLTVYIGPIIARRYECQAWSACFTTDLPIDWKISIWFVIFNIIAIPFVYFCCPETRGLSHEEIDSLFSRKDKSAAC